MSTYVYMRLLESRPQRYDRGIRLLSLGGVREMYEQTAAAAVGDREAPRVLEIGCGTGNLTAELLGRGARVTAVDQSAAMLEIARAKLDDRAELIEMAAVEIADRFPPASFDAAAATLALSEMSEDEQAFVLDAARRVLRPGGRLAIADEALPERRLARLAHACWRLPLAIVTWIFTQTSTRAIRDLAGKVRRAGFVDVEERKLRRAGVRLVTARRHVKEPS